MQYTITGYALNILKSRTGISYALNKKYALI